MNGYQEDNRIKLRRWIIFGFIALIIAGAGTIARRYQKLQPEVPKKAALAGRSVLPDLKLAEQDSDHDGLRDWEEQLYHTDPAKSDTDGDGTDDNTEVYNRRDPLKAGPNDNFIVDRKPAEQLQQQRGKNYTDDLSALFVAEYFRQKEGGNLNPENLAHQIISTYLGQNGDLEIPTTKTDDFKTINDNSTPAIKRYLNAIATLSKNRLSGAEQPLLLITNITKLDDLQTELVKFDPIIAQYQTAFEEFKKIPIPSSWLGYHKRIADLLLAQLELLKKIRASEDDLMQIFLVITQYQKTFEGFQQLRTDIRNTLAIANIRFDATEPFGQFAGAL